MIIGNFVKVNHKPLTDSETVKFDKAIRQAFEKHGFIVSESESHQLWPFNPDAPNAEYNYLGIDTKWTITPPSPIIGRNREGDRLKFYSASIAVSNTIDANGKCQYECRVRCNGAIIYFNCQSVEVIAPPKSFQYGTEVEDFDFALLASWLFKQTRLLRTTERALRTIIAALNVKGE